MIVAANKFIACAVPEKTAQETVIKSGIRTATQRVSLMPLKVVYGSAEFPVGSTIYVSTGLYTASTYSSEVFQLGGHSLVFVPEGHILLVDRDEDEVTSILYANMSDTERAVCRALQNQVKTEEE